MKASWRSVVGLLLLMANASFAAEAEDSGLPQIKSRINDYAAVLSQSQMHLLYQISAQHQFTNHNHVVVVTAASSGGESVQSYAERVWQAWQTKIKSQSVMLLLVQQPRGAAIIAGDTSAKVLNSTLIKNIIEQDITPSLTKDDYDGAAMEGLNGIVGALNR